MGNVYQASEPNCYNKAGTDANWIRAMEDELNALKRNKTWVLTDLPKVRKL